MIEDLDQRPNDMTSWELYVQRVGEPRRGEDWKSKAAVFGFLAFLAVSGGISLWLFLSGRVG